MGFINNKLYLWRWWQLPKQKNQEKKKYCLWFNMRCYMILILVNDCCCFLFSFSTEFLINKYTAWQQLTVFEIALIQSLNACRIKDEREKENIESNKINIARGKNEKKETLKIMRIMEMKIYIVFSILINRSIFICT